MGAPYSTFTQADYDHLTVHFTAGTGDEVFEFSSHTTNATPGTGYDRYFAHPEEDEWWNISAGLSEDAADGVPVVSIAATDADAEAWETLLTEQQDNKLTFTVTRSGNEEDGDFDEALTVLLHPPAGTATADDYDTIPTTITIPSGSASTTFDVTAVQGNKVEMDETVALCLKAAQDYRLAAFTAIATIHDVSIDLAIDSNNDGTIDPASKKNGKDDPIEDDATLPGKIIAVNDDDDNRNGVPDFAEHLGGSNAVVGDSFQKVTFTIPADVNLQQASFGFSYLADYPQFTAKTGDGSYTYPYKYITTGPLRLWIKNSAEHRIPKDIDDGGDWVSGVTKYNFGQASNAASLWGKIGISDQDRYGELYIEAVRPSAVLGDLHIVFEVDPDGAGPKPGITDTVRVTAVNVDLISPTHTVLNGTSKARLDSVIGEWKHTTSTVNIGIRTTPDISNYTNAGNVNWTVADPSSTKTTLPLSATVSLTRGLTYGDRTAIAELPWLHVKRSLVLNIPDVGDQTEAQVLLANWNFGPVTYLTLNSYSHEAAQFGFTNAPPSDQTLNSSGQLDAVNNSVGNSLKHAYFAARVALAYSESFSLSLTNAHEFEAQQSGWNATETVMDLFNNAVGIAVAHDIKVAGISEAQYISEIESRLLAQFNSGKLYVIRKEDQIVVWNSLKPIN